MTVTVYIDVIGQFAITSYMLGECGILAFLNVLHRGLIQIMYYEICHSEICIVYSIVTCDKLPFR